MKNFKKKIFLLLGLCLISSGLWADKAAAKHLYQQANQQFKQKNYANALDYYNKVAQEEASYAVYVQGQIGHSYYALGDYGKALYYYEKHLKLKPNDAGVKRYAQILKKRGVVADAGNENLVGGKKLKKRALYLKPGFLNVSDVTFIKYEAAMDTIQGKYSKLSLSLGALSETSAIFPTLIGGSFAWFFSTGGLDGFFIGPKSSYYGGSGKGISYALWETMAEGGYERITASGWTYGVGGGIGMVGIALRIGNFGASISAFGYNGYAKVGYAF